MKYWIHWIDVPNARTRAGGTTRWRQAMITFDDSPGTATICKRLLLQNALRCEHPDLASILSDEAKEAVEDMLASSQASVEEWANVWWALDRQRVTFGKEERQRMEHLDA